ncbi:MAG TPA: hypothetical protein VK642_07260, partial [Burkholderiales bacterium]|nr:hypothetical protein [Burkholderiales bacterium]
IFHSQSGITDRAREADWAQWYFEHLRIMATVPGVFSAQRFITAHPGHPPSLAMYGVASADVFKGDYYQSVRGMGDWLPLIDRRWYRRNLFDGLDVALVVNEDQALLVADRDVPDAALAALSFTWLKVAGIDRSTPFRGIAVVNKRAVPVLPANVAIYTPASKRFVNLKGETQE